MIIYFHPRFQKNYRKLDSKTKIQAEFRVTRFKIDPFDSILGTHHLHEKLKKQLSFSINSRCRILFEFVGKKQNEVIFLDIGDHDIYSV